MKLLSENILHHVDHIKYAMGTLVFLVLPTLLNAQIPQNIEVEGEPANGWQYLLWIMVLLFIIAAIFLILRMVNRKKEKNEESN